MNGDDVGTSDVQRLATAILARATHVLDQDGRVKYDLTAGRRTGGRKRLAEDSGMDPGQLTRLLTGERMPDIWPLARLARNLGTTLDALLVESDNYPSQSTSQQLQESVRSPLLTPEAVAESWGVDMADVRSMFEILRKRPAATPDDEADGRTEAQG